MTGNHLPWVEKHPEIGINFTNAARQAELKCTVAMEAKQCHGLLHRYWLQLESDSRMSHPAYDLTQGYGIPGSED